MMKSIKNEWNKERKGILTVVSSAGIVKQKVKGSEFSDWLQQERGEKRETLLGYEPFATHADNKDTENKPVSCSLFSAQVANVYTDRIVHNRR